jgi:hypothetical protein
LTIPEFAAHGFQIKKTKTPKRAIKIAQERKKDYFWRKMAWEPAKVDKEKKISGSRFCSGL